MRSRVLQVGHLDARLLSLIVCLIPMTVCCCVALRSSWGWPVVGDVSLMRYVVLLLHAGRAPYSQIVDINLPGSYFLDFIAMQLFGWGPHALRLYDGSLCFLLCVFAFFIGKGNRKEGWYGLAAGLFFTLVHLQDGIEQAGQRDFALAVLVFGSLAILLRAETPTITSLFFFEFLIGFSLTVKPTMFLFVLLPMVACGTSSNLITAKERVRLAIAGTAGLLLPLITMFGWLWHFNSASAFIRIMTSIEIVHSGLGRKSLFFLITHCVSPLSALLFFWISLLATKRFESDLRRKVLFSATLCGLASYIEQAKGFPYQRYPFLACLLLLIFIDISRGSHEKGVARSLSMGAIVLCSFWFAPKFTRLIDTFDTVPPFQKALEQSLAIRRNDDTIQCLDTYGGCINTLYDLRVVQATGYLYDCYLFTKPSDARDAYRARFADQFWKARPTIVVVTNEGCFDTVNMSDKLRLWPQFRASFNESYYLASEWHSNRTYKMWSRPEKPNSFRVYRLK